ncbi:MAG: homoserine O-acetyltransferase [Lentisphaerae bacterium]|nr:homoserine O-acetyltransferase [Lentisphaerota bacterium]
MRTECAMNDEQPGSVGIVETQHAQIELPPGGFCLESGETLPELTVAYETYGELSAARDNVVFVCHALSGDAHVAGIHDPPDDPAWWDEMIGPGKGIDTRYYHVVCANILGGCRGTTGPLSVNPSTGRPYGSSFPEFIVTDVVAVHRLLLAHLGIERLAAVVGGSFGGMQALDWAIRWPDSVDRCICIASGVRLSTQALAFDVVGRQAITSDPDWMGGDYYDKVHGPDSGLALARALGHITYLSPGMMTEKFGRERREDGETAPGAGGYPSRTEFQVESYLRHQGEKFIRRFDANSYLLITRAMDEFDLAESYGSIGEAFSRLEAKVLVVALSADWLFPPEQSVEIANALFRAGKRVSYCMLHAPHGHDAFLVDIRHLSEAIRAFLPWVLRGSSRPTVDVPVATAGGSTREEIDTLLEMFRPGSRVLDLGCGNGALLTMLSERRSATGSGVDIDIDHVIDVIDRGHDVFQADVDAGLAAIPDGAYDYAVLSETLQVVRRPRFVLQEMLRVAREGIVSFPNFGKWSHRLRLCLKGLMPKGGSLPFEWFDTPNIHLFTRNDFVDLCRRDGIRIVDMVCVPDNRLDRLLIAGRHCNLGADRVLARITRDPEESSGSGCRTTRTPEPGSRGNEI